MLICKNAKQREFTDLESSLLKNLAPRGIAKANGPNGL